MDTDTELTLLASFSFLWHEDESALHLSCPSVLMLTKWWRVSGGMTGVEALRKKTIETE